MSVKILATADWHIGPYDPPKRTDDFLCAIDQIADFAQEHKPDLILHGGDVFRSNRPSGEHRREAAKRIKALSSIAPTILIPGNHDIMASGSAIDAWKELAPENLHVCVNPEVVRLPFCNVVAMPWLTSRHLAEFGKSITQEVQELGKAIEMLIQVIVSNLDGKPKILLAHASAMNGAMGNYKPVVLGKDLVWPQWWFWTTPFILAHPRG
jgi:exonuclease SbcD